MGDKMNWGGGSTGSKCIHLLIVEISIIIIYHCPKKKITFEVILSKVYINIHLNRLKSFYI